MNTTSKQNSLTLTVILILAVLVPSFISSKAFTDPFIIPKTFSFYFITVGVSIIYLWRSFSRKYNTVYYINHLDIAVLVFALYQLIRAAFTKFLSVEHDSVLVLILSIFLYFLIKPSVQFQEKNSRLQTRLITGFALMCFAQASYGLLQYVDMIPRLQEQFKTGGAFGNPGPYSNFLVGLVPFTVALILITSKKEKSLNQLGWISLLVTLAVLPLTKARAAWIAAFAGIFFVLYFHYGWKNILLRWFRTLWLKITAIAGILVLMIVVSLYLFKFKEESASGRLFIWKITAEMIRDKPLTGFGYDQFMAAHNLYQADYFRSGEYSKQEAELADSVNYAFNEFLQITAETGIIGLLLFLLIMYYAFSGLWDREDKPGMGNETVIAARASVLAILVTSLFSYPLHTLPNNVLLFLMLSIISANSPRMLRSITIKERNRKLLSLLAILILILFGINQVGKFNAAKKWLHGFQLVRANKYDEAQKLYSTLYPVLNYNPYFLFNYGAELSVMGSYPKSVEILHEGAPRLNDADVYIYLGNSYEGSGALDKAIKSFEQASMIMPVKFYPKYRLAKIYLKTGQQEQAYALARQILNMEVKIPSNIVTGIRDEMEQLLKTRDDTTRR